MKRVSNQKEMDLMLPETNASNIENFEYLLDCFYYDYDTKKKVVKLLDIEAKPFPHNHLDKMLGLNNQSRAWYEIENDKESDIAFEEYERILYNNVLHFRPETHFYRNNGGIRAPGQTIREPTAPERLWMKQVKIVEDYGLEFYDTFKSNSVQVGKNVHKLFKFMLKNGIIEQHQVDRLNTLKVKDNKKYICISRNPVDMLVASINQGFTSCLDAIDSMGEGCYWMGLAALNTDPNRAIVFYSNGKLRTVTLQGYDLKHFGYLSRSWLILEESDELCHVRSFPSGKIDFVSHLKKAGIPAMDSDEFERSRFTFDMPRFEDGNAAHVYLDNIGVENGGDGWYYTPNGTTGALTHFECDANFNDISDFYQLWEGSNYCEDCGNHFHPDDGYYFENIGSICYDCFHNNYCCCCDCGEAILIDYSYIGDDDVYCEYCFNKVFMYCDNCGESDYVENMIMVEGKYGTEDWCEVCVGDHTFHCDICDLNFHNAWNEDHVNDVNDEITCDRCFEDNYAECMDCGYTDYLQDMEQLEGDNLCITCYYDREEEKNEAVNATV